MHLRHTPKYASLLLLTLSFSTERLWAQQPELRLGMTARAGSLLTASVHLTATEAEIAAVGMRLAYDPSILVVVIAGDVQRGSGLPASWSPAYLNVSNPGRIDLVFTDLSPAPSVLVGPVAGLEVARIQFQIVGPCPDITAMGFSTEAPVTPQETAAFPAAQYLSYLDRATSSVGLSPALTAIVRPKLTLRVPETAGPELIARLEATVSEGPIAAVGARLAYDASVLEISDVSRIENGSAVPPTWSKIYANVSSPGKVDFVLTDITPSPATIPSPLSGAELCRVRFRVLAPSAGPADISFSTLAPFTPQEAAAFPVNHYLEYLDTSGNEVCLLPTETCVVQGTAPSANARFCLRLPSMFVANNFIAVKVELTTNAEATFALGLRLTYDVSQVSISGESAISAGPDTPIGWTKSYVDVGTPGRVDFVFSGDPMTPSWILGPAADLHVATLTFKRRGPRPEEAAFEFNAVPPSTPAQIAAFPLNQFTRFLEGSEEGVAAASTCIVADRSDFIRSDCNGDKRVDISDPVWHLNYLFRGGPQSPCDEACNSNSDSTLDISDPVYTMNYIFLGGPAPASPFPACDRSVYCAVDICP